MPKLQNGSKEDSNPGSIDCASGILPLSYRGQIYKRTTTNTEVVQVKKVCDFIQWQPQILRSYLGPQKRQPDILRSQDYMTSNTDNFTY